MKGPILVSVILALPMAVSASPQDKPQSATERLLQAQRSGELASDTEQHLTGKTQTEIYQRYVKSFSHPIPETYIKDTFKSE